MNYRFTMYPDGDRLLSGSLLPISSNSIYTQEYKVFYISFLLYSKIRDCNPANEPILNCLNQYADKKFDTSNRTENLFAKLLYVVELTLSTMSKVRK